jgi:EmrB/QacA subfamily drug resistance transporter
MTENWTAPADTPAGPSSEPSNRRWAVLAVVLTGAFMILLDATIVNVAVPPIQKDLHASSAAIEWVIAGYALAYGLLMIPAGRLGDRFGHKRLFLLGLAGFTIASTLCGVADTPTQLVVARVVQGLFAGVMNPPIVALIVAAFPPSKTGQAYGIYGAVAGVSSAVGPLLGGLLIAWDLNDWTWRPIFMLNIPIGVAAFLAALWLVPESKGRGGSIDVVGVVLVTLSMLLITYPLVEGQSKGWPASVFVMLAASVPALALFVWWELRQVRKERTPLVDMRLFKHPAFSAGVAISVLFFTGFIGLLFALSLHLQIGTARSALAAGLTLLPFPVGSLLAASSSDKLAHKIGRKTLFLGCALLVIGMAGIVSTLHYSGSGALELLPSMFVAGLGTGMIIAPITEIVLAGVPWQEAGSASGVLTTSQRLGSAFGIAVIGAVLFGGLGSHAGTAATDASGQLRDQLATAGVTGSAADSSVASFTDCFVRQSTAMDPTAVPPGCAAPDTSSPTGAAFANAASTALEDNFSRGAQLAIIWAIGAILLTFLLVAFLPKKMQSWSAEDWGGGDGGDWGGGGGDGQSWTGGEGGGQSWEAGGDKQAWEGGDKQSWGEKGDAGGAQSWTGGKGDGKGDGKGGDAQSWTGQGAGSWGTEKS